MPQDWNAEAYDRELQRGVSLSGEAADFFAAGRVAQVASHLDRHRRSPRTILEFGCGTGNNLRHLRSHFTDAEIIGVDISREMLGQARDRLGAERLTLVPIAEFEPERPVDLVFVNGVFHHIPGSDHIRELTRIRGWLAPGGTLALFENNPFSPAARWVMHRIPFDRDAVMINPYVLARQIAGLGFDRVQARFYFLFPNVFRALRPLEQHLERLPLGAQYGVFGRLGGGDTAVPELDQTKSQISAS